MPSQTVRAAADGTEIVHLRSAAAKVVRARAPLRLGLAGGGTDVSPYTDQYGGLVLNATIDRYCYATVADRGDGRVRLESSDTGVAGWLDDGGGDQLPLHAATYRRVCKEYGLGSPSLTMTTVAEAPPGSGLGSSSTLVVSLVEAFREFFSLPLGEYDVARLAYAIERQDCGFDGGRQDQYAATFGGFNAMEFSAGERVIVNPLRLKDAVIQELEASLVVFHTGVSRSSGAIIERQAAHVKAGDADRIEATHALKEEATNMKEALLTGDLGQVASILRSGWDAKKRLSEGISTSHIETVFTTAVDAGALAGKVSGAGGGGFAMFLVGPEQRPKLLAALRALESGQVEPIHFVSEGASAWTLR